MRDPGTIFLGDLLGFGPSRLTQTHLPASVSFTDTLNEGRITPAAETPLAQSVFAHPTLAPSVELIGLAAIVLFLVYMDKQIRVAS